MPLFPGTLRFLADPQEPGVIPKATDAFSWTSAQYDTWKTVGTLVVQLNPALVLEIAALPGASEPIPALAWYWPVRLTEAFLFDAIRTHLIKDRIRTGTGRFVETDATSWPQHAVASFLAGSHSVELRLPADPLQDDAVQFLTKMPTVEMTATGEVGLWVALAAGIRIDDRQPLPALPGTTPLLDPRHPGNALLHARKTLTDLALETIGAEQPGSVLAAAALTPWPVGPRYFQVTFTTPGMPRKRYHSGLLPAEEITIRDTGGTVLQQRRLCTNGIVTIAQASAMPMPTPPQLSLTITSNVLRIGETTGSRAGLGSNDIRFDFTTLASPARVSLQPPAPNPPTAAAKRAYSKKLAGLCIKAARAQTTHEAVARVPRRVRELDPPRRMGARRPRLPWHPLAVEGIA